MTFRPPGITAKAAATLDALTGGRAFVGVGAGWWDREHAAYGLPFPPARERLDALEAAIETMRALWARGHQGVRRRLGQLPETTSLPAAGRRHPGDRRRQRRATHPGDRGPARRRLQPAVDVGSSTASSAVLRAAPRRVGRPYDDLEVTVLDLPVVGRDRDDVWARVERLRGRTPAAAYARKKHAGTVAQQRDR